MTSASNFSTGFLPVLFLFLSVHAVGGQEKGVVPWQFKGFVDTYHAFRTREPNDLMSSRARVRGGDRQKLWRIIALRLVQHHLQRFAEGAHGG